jgi:hypothetical protein
MDGARQCRVEADILTNALLSGQFFIQENRGKRVVKA